MYCQGLDCSPIALFSGLLRGATLDGCTSWHQFQNRTIIPTFQARTAIALALRAWSIGTEDEVLAPAYNCGTDIDPILKSGAHLRLYKVRSDLSLDIADIRRLVTPRTRVIYVTHFFGWPQAMAELRAYCDQKGIKIIEDCALALFSRGPEGWLGRQGDGAIFSLPKMIAVPEGGILLLKDAPAETGRTASRPPPIKIVCRRVFSFSKRFMLRKLDAIGIRRHKHPALRLGLHPNAVPTPERPDMPPSYYFGTVSADRRMPRITRGLLHSIVPSEVIEWRRHNYLRLLNLIRGLPGVQPIFSGLDDGICPVGLPIRVRNRSAWVHALSASNIDVYAWWAGYHSGIEWSQFPEACLLKDEILLLPVHQQLDDRHVDYVGRRVAAVAKAFQDGSSGAREVPFPIQGSHAA